MALRISRFVALIILGVYAGGVLFASALFFPRAQELPGVAYVRYWQAQNLDFGARMPPLLLTGLALLLIVTILSIRQGWRILTPTALAAILTVFVIVLTVTQMEPLNRLADSWNPDALPADWVMTRDLWARWHLIRTALSTLAFGCLLASQAISPRNTQAARLTLD